MLPVILKHPLGLGLNGYLYTQSSFQTGVYSVKFVHNDFLQLMLDVGWVPCLLLLFAIGKTLCSKTNSPQKKIILCTFLVHFCLDFDLQYISMFCIFLTLLDFDGGRTLVIENRPAKILKWTCIPLAALCLYMGVALGSSYLGLYYVSYSLYPWNVENESRLIMETEDPVEMEMLADDVLRRNPYLVLAWTVKSSVAYQNGDISSVMQYKHHIFDIAPFAYDEYKEYCQMLIAACQMYVEAGDMESAKVCAEELRTTRESLEQLPLKLSDLGTKIADQPKTKLPKEIDDYIDAL